MGGTYGRLADDDEVGGHYSYSAFGAPSNLMLVCTKDCPTSWPESLNPKMYMPVTMLTYLN